MCALQERRGGDEGRVGAASGSVRREYKRQRVSGSRALQFAAEN